MRKRHLVLAIVLLSLVFVIFQLGLVWKFPKTEQKFSVLENGFSTAYVSIQAFTDVCHKHGFPVFVIDPVLLKDLMSNKSLVAQPCGNGACQFGCNYLCADYSVMTFGVISQLWQIQDAYNDFHSKGFTVNEYCQVTNHDLHSNWNRTSTPTHYTFQHSNKHVIHLVLFYQQQKNFYRHGKLGNLDSSNHKLKFQLHFGRDEGAYTSFDMVKVKIDGLRLRAPSYPLAFLRQISESKFTACNQSRADEFHQKNGKPDSTDKARRFYNGARQLLVVAKEVLDQIGIRFWISSGTCLGWFRQCDLIPYSKDVDIGIWITDYDAQLIPEMQNAGLVLIHKFGKVNDSYELSFSADEVKLDIFFFYEEQDCMWNGGTQARTGKKFKYVFPKFQLCWTLFLGLAVQVPCETVTYIEANYGKNWFEPVKTWDWKKSPPNVQENGVWSEAERTKFIQIYT